MNRAEILQQVMQQIANDGNEKAKMAMGLIEYAPPFVPDAVFSELTSAMEKLNKASEHVASGYQGSAQIALDQIRMHIHKATIALTKSA